MSKVYLLVNDEPHESTEIIAAYADQKDAERKRKKLEHTLAAYRNRQQQLEQDGNEQAYAEAAPHCWNDLHVMSIVVKPVTKKESGK